MRSVDSSPSLKTLLGPCRSEVCWNDQRIGARRGEPVFPEHTGEARRSRGHCTLAHSARLLISRQNTLLHSVAFWPRVSEEWCCQQKCDQTKSDFSLETLMTAQSEQKWICVRWQWETTTMFVTTDPSQGRSKPTWLRLKDWKEGGMERVWLTGVISSKMIWMIPS